MKLTITNSITGNPLTVMVDKSVTELGLEYKEKGYHINKSLITPGRGIYAIMNLVNGKVYVGKSERMSKRIMAHYGRLNKGKHRNKHLQSSFDIYGKESFIAYSLEVVDDHQNLSERELFWATKYNSFQEGYNMATINTEQTWHLDISNKLGYKLSTVDVIMVCDMLNKQISAYQIAEKFKVSSSTIYDIKLGHSRKGISKKFLNEDILVDAKNKKKDKQKQVIEICKLINQGVSIGNVSKRFHVSSRVICNIVKGKHYREISQSYLNNYVEKVDYFQESEIIKICHLLNAGVSNKEIAEQINISEATVLKIKSRQIYSDITKAHLNDSVIISKRINDEKVKEICELINKGYTNTVISNRANVSISIVHKIRTGESHLKISKKYFDKITINNKRLSEEQVIAVCGLLNKGISGVDIATKLKISEWVVSKIKIGESYADISNKYLKKDVVARSKLTENDAIKVCNDLNQGLSIKEIAEKHDLKVSAIQRIKEKKTFIDIGQRYLS